MRFSPPPTTGLRIRLRPAVRFETKMKIAPSAKTVGGMVNAGFFARKVGFSRGRAEDFSEDRCPEGSASSYHPTSSHVEVKSLNLQSEDLRPFLLMKRAFL